MSTLDLSLADPIRERREIIQRVARRSLQRRIFISRAMQVACFSALILSLCPLVGVVVALLSRGLGWLDATFLTTQPQIPSLINPNHVGGISNAIIGSLMIDTIAAAIAVPIGIIAGLLLAESRSRFASIIRGSTEIMTGLPTILFGIFAFNVLVVGVTIGGVQVIPSLGVSAYAGAFALSLVMIPIIMKAAETSLRFVPTSLREAALALGARRSVVARKVVLPTALPGLITACLIALSRAVGETAPLLFVVGATIYAPLTFDPHKETAVLPLTIFQSATSQYPSQQSAAWGAALFLVIVVLVINLGSRIVAALLRR